jgi:hypothetical protein
LKSKRKGTDQLLPIERICHNYSGQLMTFVLIYRHVSIDKYKMQKKIETNKMQNIKR